MGGDVETAEEGNKIHIRSAHVIIGTSLLLLGWSLLNARLTY